MLRFTSLLIAGLALESTSAFLLRSRDNGTSGASSGNQCDPNWEMTRSELRRNRLLWANPACYTMTVERSCFCAPAWLGPFDVVVRDGVVVEPANAAEFDLPTMEDLFDLIRKECVSGCPAEGAAECQVEYGADGAISSLFIDRSFQIADEEIRYFITNVTICEE